MSKTKRKFFKICHGLHNYGDHEYMYIKEICKIQTSGILIESMTNGIPYIVPKDNWMEKELNFSGGGVSLNPHNINDSGRTVIKALDDYNHFKNLSLNNTDKIKVLHGPKAQTQKSLEFC